jgi:RNA polymerase sigma factor (sigma-70 family)
MQNHTSNHQAFPPTQWSVLISARADDSRERSRALEQICNTYWHPIYAYTRKRGFGSQDAEDITQGFFAHLLETDEFTRMREEKGKLRTFLLVAVRNFMAADRRRHSAQKRGGQAQVLSIDVDAAEDQTCLEPADKLTPEIVFERHWASTMLHTVMGRLQRAFEDDGKAEVFHALKEFLIRGSGKQSYRDVAGRLGLSESAARVAAHRMRKRYREMLLEEIAGTLAPDDSVAEELRYLFGVFES